MGNLDYKSFAKRHRPHIHPLGGILFLTYRLAGSIPRAMVREYKAKKEWLDNDLRRAQKVSQTRDESEAKQRFERVEKFRRDWFLKFAEILHQAKTGPMWMQDERVAKNVAENIHRLDGDAYRLDAYSVMSNHVHTVFKPFLSEEELEEAFDENGRLRFNSKQPCLARIMQSLKGRSARECNLILCRNGQFWEHESFDHVIRSGKFNATIRYVLNNPVKAGLVKDWREWRWNYCRSELSEEL